MLYNYEYKLQHVFFLIYGYNLHLSFKFNYRYIVLNTCTLCNVKLENMYVF